MSFLSRALLYQALADVTVGQSAAEASGLSANRTQAPMIPAGMPQAGTEVACTASGFYTLPPIANLTDLTVRIMLGAAVVTADIKSSLLNTFGLALLGGPATAPFLLSCTLTYRSAGATAKVTPAGYLAFVDSGGTFRYKDLLNGGADLTVDTTVDCPFDVRVKWGAANASSMTIRAAKLTAVGPTP